MRINRVRLARAEKFCAFMDLPCAIFRSFYNSVISQIRDAMEAIKNLVIKKASEIEKQLINEKCESVMDCLFPVTAVGVNAALVPYMVL